MNLIRMTAIPVRLHNGAIVDPTALEAALSSPTLKDLTKRETLLLMMSSTTEATVHFLQAVARRWKKRTQRNHNSRKFLRLWGCASRRRR